MNGLTKYILFVFTKNDNPKEFTEQIADELSVLSDTPNLNYYYGPESSVFTISTLDSYEDVKDYVDDATYEEFAELRTEVEHFIDRRKRYFKDEMDEFERAAQDLTRDEGLNISVDKIINSFLNSKEITLNDKVWSKLETPNQIKLRKGNTKKVIDIDQKYNKSSPKELSKAIKSGDYKRPLILKFGDRYHLVAGNTRLCTAAALGIKPKVLIGEI